MRIGVLELLKPPWKKPHWFKNTVPRREDGPLNERHVEIYSWEEKKDFSARSRLRRYRLCSQLYPEANKSQISESATA